MFTGEHPPARRTTDAATAMLSVGMTLTMVAVVIRAALRGDWVAVWLFAAAGSVIAGSSIALCSLVIRWHLAARARRRAAERASEAWMRAHDEVEP
jgi:uncharacterized membrane protein (DUF485 family)